MYAFLHNLAERGSGSVDKHGVLRHDLGKEFWNAVRIRGTVHGYRYEFTYTNMGESTSQGIGDSRTVVAKVNKRMGALSNMVPDELADLADTAKRMMKKFPKVDTSGMSNEQLIAKAMELGML